MKSTSFKGWGMVAQHLTALAAPVEIADERSSRRKRDQRWSACESTRHRKTSSEMVSIADEVGMGKTRIAVTLASSVIRSGGRVAILVPPGLGAQWQDELRGGGVEAPKLLRSLWQFLSAWREPVPLKNHGSNAKSCWSRMPLPTGG